MKLTLLGTGIALSLLSSISMASSYRGEIDLGYVSTENAENTTQASFKWYFKPVTTSFKKLFKKTISHPLAEAAFLEKSSSIGVTYHTQTVEDMGQLNIDNFDDDDLLGININGLNDFDSSVSTFSLDYFVPETIFYVGIQYHKTTQEITSRVKASENNWGLSAGLMPAENLLITTTYSDNEDYTLNFNAKYVVELAGSSAVNFVADYTRITKEEETNAVSDDEDKEDDILRVSGDYYFDRTFSIGTGLIFTEETGYELRAQKFFTESISTKLLLRTIDNTNTYSISISARL